MYSYKPTVQHMCVCIEIITKPSGTLSIKLHRNKQ